MFLLKGVSGNLNKKKENNKKLSEKFHEVLKYEGVVSIMSWGVEPHLVNTWNSYLVTTDDERILIPAYGFRKTEKNIEVNPTVTIALGSKDVLGFKDYQCTGFIVEGNVKYLEAVSITNFFLLSILQKYFTFSFLRSKKRA